MALEQAQRRTFFGVSTCNIDSQRRILMPKNWRLDSDTGQTRFFIIPSFPNIIKVYDENMFNRMMDTLMAVEENDPDNLEGQMRMGALSESFTPDRQGRFTISQDIIDFGKLGSKIVFVGCLTYGRIIASEVWEQCGKDLASLQKLEKSMAEARRAAK